MDSFPARPEWAGAQTRCILLDCFSGSKPEVKIADASLEICPREKFVIVDLESLITALNFVEANIASAGAASSPTAEEVVRRETEAMEFP